MQNRICASIGLRGNGAERRVCALHFIVATDSIGALDPKRHRYHPLPLGMPDDAASQLTLGDPIANARGEKRQCRLDDANTPKISVKIARTRVGYLEECWQLRFSIDSVVTIGCQRIDPLARRS